MDRAELLIRALRWAKDVEEGDFIEADGYYRDRVILEGTTYIARLDASMVLRKTFENRWFYPHPEREEIRTGLKPCVNPFGHTRVID
jgi:hypothetical protein